MSIANIIVTYVSALGLLATTLLFFRYVKLKGRELRGLNPLLLSMVSIFFVNALTALCYFLPEGKVLYYSVLAIFLFTMLFCTTIMQFLVQIGTKESRKSRMFQYAMYLFPLVVLVMCLFPSCRGLVLPAVLKTPDSFGFLTQSSVVQVCFALYQNSLCTFCLVLVLYTDRRKHQKSRNILWVLLVVLLLPLVSSVLTYCFPYLQAVHINNLLSWIAVWIIAYIFYGYLFTARQKAVEAMHEAYIVFDMHGNTVDINSSAEALFLNLFGTVRPTFAQFCTLIGEDDPHMLDRRVCTLSTPEGKKYYSISAFKISDTISRYCGNGFALSEITEYMLKVDSLSALATEDPLTGAKNRRYFTEYAHTVMQTACKLNQPVSVMMLDLDHFKQVNDVYGHLVGDEVLKTLCRICMQNLRKDDVLCRFGGEEFLILCENLGRDDAFSLAQRIRFAVSKSPVVTSAGDIPVTVSIGVFSFWPDEGDSLEVILEQTDSLMYKAKQNGRNRVEQNTAAAGSD